MSSIKIQNLPIKEPIGAMKLPTGGFGDYSVTVYSLGDYIVDYFNIATKDYVDNIVANKEDRILTTGGNLTPVSQLSEIPDTNNDTIDEVAQALLDRIEYVKDNFSSAPAHNELTGRSATGAHPSTSISHKSGTVYSYLISNEQDINQIKNIDIPSINQSLSEKQDLIESGVALTPTPALYPVPSVSHTGLNTAIQAVLNRTAYYSNHSNLTNRSDVNSHPASAIQDSDGTSQQDINNDYKVTKKGVPIFADLKTDGTDETVNFKAYVNQAKSSGRELLLPKGVILISDTVDVDFTFLLRGAGRDATIIRFNNTTLGKPIFSFKRGGTKSFFRDFTIQEQVLFNSTAIRMTDTRTDVGTPLWKCRFDNVEIIGCNIAIQYTSENPLLGADHAHCSENVFINCKFSGNKVWVLNQNCQAVNNMYIKCEVENSDTSYLNGQTLTDNNLEFLRDEAGGGTVIIGGSYIGRGRFAGWLYPTGGTNLFGGSGTLTVIGGTRLECRTTHYGCLFEELSGGNTSNSKFYEIFVRDVRALVYAANLDLIRFGGRVGAYFSNVSTVSSSGRLYVRQYPTLGQSSTESTGSLGSITVEDCGSVQYKKETTTPYGTYNQNSVLPVSIRGTKSNSSNASFTNDSKGWATLFSGGDSSQLPYQYGNIKAPSRIVYNRDWTSSGIPAGQQLKFCMPENGRPLKIFCFKNPLNIATDHTFTLYLVKDNANWADPNTFNIATDAVSVAVTPSSLNLAGSFESPVRLGSSVFGSELKAGFGSWLEGRMLIVNNGSTSFSGFVGVEYI